MSSSVTAIVDISKRKVGAALRELHPDSIVIGKDILELLSSSMYVDPMTIYREYIQNAADAIDEAKAAGLLADSDGKVHIEVNSSARVVRIRDNGIGIPHGQFASRLSSLGASKKRGTPSRGFRGVGRLAGLGYCQELIFRSQAMGESVISELRWDCRKLKSLLRDIDAKHSLVDLVHVVASAYSSPAKDHATHFFEVELHGIVRHGNDRLLNSQLVGEYLSQVAPVPFHPEFRHAMEITTALENRLRLGNLHILINGSESPIFRPFLDQIDIGDGKTDDVNDVSFHEIPGLDGLPAAVAWVLHHGYVGAIPNSALVKGLRLRTGNMQVGDSGLLEGLFPEPRFNAWSIGEVHVIDRRVVPNGRRDHFEQSVHFDNICNHLSPIARDIARRCRQSSITRKWLRDFDLHRSSALDKATAVAKGALSASATKIQSTAAAKALVAMRKIAESAKVSAEVGERLKTQARATEARVQKLLGRSGDLPDPLARARPDIRVAYQHILSLIYEYSSNHSAANSLIEKILNRLRAEAITRPAKAKERKKKRPAKG